MRLFHKQNRVKITFICGFALLFVGCIQQANITHSAFLQKTNWSAEDYLIKKLQSNSLVVLCERHHKDITQYELIQQLIQNQWVQNNVKCIFTETGVTSLYPRIHQLLFNSPNLLQPQLDSILIGLVRDIDYTPSWDAPSYINLIRTIYSINEQLPIHNKIDLIPCDYAFSWKSIGSVADYDNFYYGIETPFGYISSRDRDSVIFENISNRFDSIQNIYPNAKGLVILNFRHAFLCNTHYNNLPSDIHINTGKLLKDHYGNKLASIYINSLGYPKSYSDYTLIQNGKWDACFISSNKLNVGFDLKSTPFGCDSVDLTPYTTSIDHYIFSDLFTGMVYYKPPQQHRLISGLVGFVDSCFHHEFERRTTIYYQSRELPPINIEQYINKINTKREKQYDNIDSLIFLINKNIKNITIY